MPVGIGTTFQFPYADTQVTYTVKAARGTRAWDCEVLGDLDYAGHKKVFGTEEIERAIAHARMFDDLHLSNQDWWDRRVVGETLHYHDSFGRYVRGVVALVEGKKSFVPTALVGAWNWHDLVFRNAFGEIVRGYHAKRIVEGDNDGPWRPDVGCMVEGRHRYRPGEHDPRTLPEHDLSDPPITTEQEEAARLYAITKALTGLVNAYDVDLRDNVPVSEQLRAKLIEAKRILDEAAL